MGSSLVLSFPLNLIKEVERVLRIIPRPADSGKCRNAVEPLRVVSGLSVRGGSHEVRVDGDSQLRPYRKRMYQPAIIGAGFIEDRDDQGHHGLHGGSQR